MVSPELIQEAARRLAKKFHPRRIILFGSQARGASGKNSDVDLLIIGPYSKKRLALMTKMHEALSGLNFPCDIVVLTPQEFEIDRQIPGTIARPAWKEGKILYAA